MENVNETGRNCAVVERVLVQQDDVGTKKTTVVLVKSFLTTRSRIQLPAQDHYKSLQVVQYLE